LAPVAQLLGRRLAGVDLAIVCAHAELGGSGLVHAAARACGLPVLGPQAPTIELAFDKLRARARLMEHNVPVPRTVALGHGLDAVGLERLGWPCVIKPRRGAAGRGVRRLASWAELSSTHHASTNQEDVVVEREVVGRELSVVLLDGAVLGIAEIVRSDWASAPRPYSSHASSTVICPPDLDRIARAGLEQVARRAASALELHDGPIRVDLLWSARACCAHCRASRTQPRMPQPAALMCAGNERNLVLAMWHVALPISATSRIRSAMALSKQLSSTSGAMH
jgi:D-alanine-D-alanine ligase-like ATP-grasp enzyme